MKTGEWSRGQGKEKGKGLEGRKEKGKGQGGIRGRMGIEAFFQTKIYHIHHRRRRVFVFNHRIQYSNSTTEIFETGKLIGFDRLCRR